jgi:hypothetical protein
MLALETGPGLGDSSMSSTRNAYVLAVFFTAVALNAQEPQTIIAGLQGPQKVILTSGGNFLVSETSREPDSGRISFITRGGARRTLFANMPSGLEVAGGGSGPTAMALDGRTLYVAIGGGDAERMAPAPTPGNILNPQGMSSPLFSTILQIDFPEDLDSLTGTFEFTGDMQRRLADGYPIELRDRSGAIARVSVLSMLPLATPDPVVRYRFSNLWGMALDPSSNTLYVADASQNALLEVDTRTGRWRRSVRFGAVRNPTPLGPPASEAVPTSVRFYGNHLLVSMLTGFPFAAGQARVMYVDRETRETHGFIYGLTSATDVLVRHRAQGRPQFFVLEFSRNQLAGTPGRLIRYDTEAPTEVATLITPVSMALDEATGTLYVLQLNGQLVAINVGP